MTTLGRLGDWVTGSLAARLVVTAGLWSAVALAAAGLILTQLYTDSLIRSFDERVIVFEKTLAGIVASTPEGTTPDPGIMGDPRFGRVQSGWYWMVVDAKTRELVAASQSLLGESLDLPAPPNNGVVVTGFASDAAGTRLRKVSQRIYLSGGRMYDLTVTGNVAELSGEIGTFRVQVFATLAIFALGLLAGAVLQVRFGLRPLAAMSRGLAAVREGRASRLEGRLPREIAPLGRELNALIESNGAIVERSRTQVGNLAHALKTPLAVVLNEARSDGGPLAELVIEQVTVMRAEVERYLDRARMAADRRIVGASAELAPSLAGLARVLRKAYPDRAIELDAADDGLRARIERRDLEEVIGNLMDNACKYGRARVRVSARAGPDGPEVAVEDDGPGLADSEFATVLGRGKRLDETVPGSGFGLAIAAEIVETWGGRIGLGRSPLGGLKVAVALPPG